ncbi:nuclease-related domain-containing DEAD/DEAH box helicase [Tomitella biformata]|uniref:nuclease-related domain-containing DEAD/DEAH box helicase n=1 Tax=Tomitella biformata TaxID=630403 RepID=UPI000465C050|nr:ATP-binding domain-containing protein [Tomitella biformata]
MVIALPEQPHLANTHEKNVWQALLNQAGDGDLVIASQRVAHRAKDYEIDFVLAMPGAGIVCLEVKGGRVWHDGTSWMQAQRSGDAPIDPVRQVREGTYALREYVERDPRWTGRRVRWDHMVVLPVVELPEDFALPDCPRWKVIDRTQLDRIVTTAYQELHKQERDHRFLDDEDVAVLRSILSGRGLPQRDVVAQSNENEDHSSVLTAQQGAILDATRNLTRVEVRGGAGSGKTYLALEKARRLTAEGQRVAVLCYSHGLASYLRRITDGWSWRDKPAYVGEFHALGMIWGAKRGPDESVRGPAAVEFWEHDLPREMAELAAALDDKARFDAIVIDEAQDFADDWWRPILGALRDEESGGLYLFSDEGQRVFDREGVPPVTLVPLVLDSNLRNTRQIAEAFKPLVGQRMRLRGGEGPVVRYVPCRHDEALGIADDQVDALLDEGWRPGDVALLSTSSRHPEQISRQRLGVEAYWDSFWDDEQVFYGHVLGFKGLERNALVLAINESEARDRSRERLYVGLSRARDMLVVCGPPDLIRQVGGDELARRLGIDTSGSAV